MGRTGLEAGRLLGSRPKQPQSVSPLSGLSKRSHQAQLFTVKHTDHYEQTDTENNGERCNSIFLCSSQKCSWSLRALDIRCKMPAWFTDSAV